MINVAASAVLGLMDRVNESGNEEKPATAGLHGEFAALLATSGRAGLPTGDTGTDAASAASGGSRSTFGHTDASVDPPARADGDADGFDRAANADPPTPTANDTPAPSARTVPSPTETAANRSPAGEVPAAATRHPAKHLSPQTPNASAITENPTDAEKSASDPSRTSTPVLGDQRLLTPVVTADLLAKEATRPGGPPAPGIVPVTAAESGRSQSSPKGATQPTALPGTPPTQTPTSGPLALTSARAAGSAQRQDHPRATPSMSGAPSDPATSLSGAIPPPGSALAIDTHRGGAGTHPLSSTTAVGPTGSAAPATTGSPAAGAPATGISATGTSSPHLSPTRTADASELPGVASQLTSVLAPLRPIPAGGHTVTIALQPEGLGTVRATMTSTDDQLVVRIATSSPQADVAVRSALPELHAALSGGHQATTVTLADSGSASNPWANAQTNSQGADQHATPDRFADRSQAETPLAAAAMAVGSPDDTTTTTTSSTGLDVRM